MDSEKIADVLVEELEETKNKDSKPHSIRGTQMESLWVGKHPERLLANLKQSNIAQNPWNFLLEKPRVEKSWRAL